MPREVARFVVNAPAEVEVVTTDLRGGFDAYVEHLRNQYVLGLQIPLPIARGYGWDVNDAYNKLLVDWQ